MSEPEDLIALLQRARQRVGPQPFLQVGDEVVSGAGFVDTVFATARGLRARGFRAGDRLAVHVHRCVDEAVALLAAMVAGGMAVPINGKLKDAQVAHVLADSAPAFVLVSAIKAAALRDPAAVYGATRLLHSGAQPPRGLAAEPFAALSQADGELPAVAPRQPATLLYTSGSTGLPKGIVQDHHNLTLGARLVAGYLHLGAADHILAVLPFSFDYGLNQLLSALAAGCRITAADYLGTAELASLLQQVRPTGLAGVPSLWHDVAQGLRQGLLVPACGDSLRYVTSSGGRFDPLDIDALRAHWPRLQVFSMYGLTEAFRSAYLEPAELERKRGSFGKALPGVELLLVEPGTTRVLDGAATGELVHAGALVAQGYWQRAEATAARFRSDPRGVPGTVVYSGDLVRRDAEGFHWFVARLDRMLKVSGHRLSPDEVAAAVGELPAVREVAVFGREAGAQGHRIVLCLAGSGTPDALRELVLRECRRRLPSYMVPAEVVVLPALPRTPNGKIDVVALEREVPPCTDNR